MNYWKLPEKGNKKKTLILNDEGVGHVYYGEEDEYTVSSTLKKGNTPQRTELTP